MTLAEFIRLTLLEQETEAQRKAWKKLIRQMREDRGDE